VNNEIAIHICPDKEDVRNFYIPIEPAVFTNLDRLMEEVERRIAWLVDKYEEPKTLEERRYILEKCIDEVCEVKPNYDGNGFDFDTGNGSGNGNGNNNGNGNGSSKLLMKFLPRLWKGNGHAKKVVVTPLELKAIKYLMVRDKVGLGILEPFIRDPNIEDISCSGLGYIFVEHKIFESLKAPVKFESKKDLDDFIIKLSEKIGKPISYRNPIMDATLPDGSRINIVYGEDISKKGSNFTIRKFSETPLSVLQLIEFGTFNYLMAAYFWICLHEGMNHRR